MNSVEKPVEQILEDYKKAIAWVESIIFDIKPNCRIYNYLQ